MGRWQSLQHFAYLSIQDTFTYDPLLLLWTWNENSFSYSTTYCLDPASWIGEDKIYASKSPNVRLYSTFSSREKKEWESFNLHFAIWISRIEEVILVFSKSYDSYFLLFFTMFTWCRRVCVYFLYIDFVTLANKSPHGLGVKKLPYTANVYRDLQGLYGEIQVRGFQIYGDCMYIYPQSL